MQALPKRQLCLDAHEEHTLAVLSSILRRFAGRSAVYYSTCISPPELWKASSRFHIGTTTAGSCPTGGGPNKVAPAITPYRNNSESPSVRSELISLTSRLRFGGTIMV